MNGRFKLDDYRHFIIEFKNNDVLIFAANDKDYPTIPLFLTPFNDIEKQKYLNIDKTFIGILNTINSKYPIFKICYEEKLIITKNHKLFHLTKNNNQYNIAEIVIDYAKENMKNDYEKILDKLENGEKVHIGSYLIDLETIKRCIKNSNIFNSIPDEETKNTLTSIADIYRQKLNNKLSSFAQEEEKNIKQEQHTTNENNQYNMKDENNEHKRIQVTDEQYKILYNKLLNGQTINIGNINLSYDTIKEFSKDENLLNNIEDNRIKDVFINLIKLYKLDQKNNEEIAGGSSNAKVKTKRAGFASRLFILSLAGFTTGIVVTFVFIMLKKYF